ncbi:MAG: hypothetical protein IT393_07180 [Nitrospirae bacterium]|nr:hypothetical protein [Nitrospirota bacterium]
MQLKTIIKKVSTTTKDDGIDANVVFEFIVTPQTIGALMELLELQGQTVILNVAPVQQDLYRQNDIHPAMAGTLP